MFGLVKDIIRLLRIQLVHLGVLFRRDIVLEEKILIVAPHPDDEVIGCSGLIQTFLKASKEVYVVILTGGESSHKGCCSVSTSDLIAARRGLAIKVDMRLGIKRENLHFLDYQDGNIHESCLETEKLAKLIQEIRPNAIFIPHNQEGWSDHLQAGNIVRSLVKYDISIQLYEYCVWFWYYNTWNIDWRNAFLCVMTKEEHDLKNWAINTYIFPKASCGKPWSGLLPKVLVNANRWNKELFFKIK